MKESSLYICDTLYHLYVFLVMCDKSKKNNLILTDFTESLPNCRERLLQLPYVNEVYVVNSSDFQQSFVNTGIAKKLYRGFFYSTTLRKSLLSNFPFLNSCLLEKEVFLFVDVSHLARFFLINHRNVILLDDGEGNYFPLNKGVKYFFKHYIFRLPEGRGVSRSIVKVCLRKPEKLDHQIKKRIGHKLVRLELGSMEKRLNKSNVSNIFFVFNLDGHFKKEGKSVLIFTQPFSEDSFISEEYKVNMYRDIANYYADSNVFIKPHPREKTNYEDIFGKSLVVIDKDVPSECFNLDLNFSFDIGVAIQSTALDNACFVNHKVSLGYESYPELKLGKEKKDEIKIN